MTEACNNNSLGCFQQFHSVCNTIPPRIEIVLRWWGSLLVVPETQMSFSQLPQLPMTGSAGIGDRKACRVAQFRNTIMQG